MAADPFSELELLALVPALRRLTAALALDADTADDVVQETLARLLAIQSRLNRETLASYAMVTARNLAVSLRRAEERRTRHLHRLAESDTTGSPEDDVLRREEHRALAAALTALPEPDRALLTTRELTEEPTEELARRAGISAATLAVRSSRARARLRVEYLLAFRRVQPPTPRCRPVLLALSAGDRRRQADLHAGRHLLACTSCSALAEPLLHRSRRLTGVLPWLALGQLAAAIHRAAGRTLSHRPVQVAAAGATAGAVAAVLVLTLTSHPPPKRASPHPATLTVAGRPIHATEASHLRRYTGQPAVAHRAPVLAVPANEGFWIGAGGPVRVWVQLVGRGESLETVKAGDHVTFRGVVVANPAGFSAHVGLDADDGAHLLDQQGAHIAVTYRQLNLSRPTPS